MIRGLGVSLFSDLDVLFTEWEPDEAQRKLTIGLISEALESTESGTVMVVLRLSGTPLSVGSEPIVGYGWPDEPDCIRAADSARIGLAYSRFMVTIMTISLPAMGGLEDQLFREQWCLIGTIMTKLMKVLSDWGKLDARS